jgi:FixJ family two-component response regulator
MSTSQLGRVLIIDDEVELMTSLQELLPEQGYEARGFTSAREALAELKERDYDVLLTDLMMPEMDGISALAAALSIDPHLVGIIMTGQATVKTAVDAMKAGAFDYILKPFKLRLLLPVISRAMEVRRLRVENIHLHETLALYELSKAISVTLDPITILNKLTEAAMHQCNADEVSVMLPTSDRKELYVAAALGEGRQHIVGKRMPIEAGIAGWVATHGETLTLNGEVDDPALSPTNHGRMFAHRFRCLCKSAASWWVY